MLTQSRAVEEPTTPGECLRLTVCCSGFTSLMSLEKRGVWGETTRARDLALEGNKDRQPGSVLPDILCILAEPPRKRIGPTHKRAKQRRISIAGGGAGIVKLGLALLFSSVRKSVFRAGGALLCVQCACDDDGERRGETELGSRELKRDENGHR